MKQLAKAISIAATAFEDRTDKGGFPYIMHCIIVMESVSEIGQEAQIAGVLHDIVEDCPEWNFDRLEAEGFSHQVISVIRLLTHDPVIEYMDYIKAISISPLARAIKMADLRHNSDIHRMKGLREKDFIRLKKYHKAYDYLKNVRFTAQGSSMNNQ